MQAVLAEDKDVYDGAAQTTLRRDQGPPFELHVPETPPTHARLPQLSLLSPVWYTFPFGHVQDPPCPPTPGAFSVTTSPFWPLPAAAMSKRSI